MKPLLVSSSETLRLKQEEITRANAEVERLKAENLELQDKIKGWQATKEYREKQRDALLANSKALAAELTECQLNFHRREWSAPKLDSALSAHNKLMEQFK